MNGGACPWSALRNWRVDPTRMPWLRHGGHLIHERRVRRDRRELLLKNPLRTLRGSAFYRDFGQPRVTWAETASQRPFLRAQTSV